MNTNDIIMGLSNDKGTVNNDTDNPFRGHNLMGDSVKSRDSDLRPGVPSGPGLRKPYEPEIVPHVPHTLPTPSHPEPAPPIREKPQFAEDDEEDKDEDVDLGFQLEKKAEHLQFIPQGNFQPQSEDDDENEPDQAMMISKRAEELRFAPNSPNEPQSDRVPPNFADDDEEEKDESPFLMTKVDRGIAFVPDSPDPSSVQPPLGSSHMLRSHHPEADAQYHEANDDDDEEEEREAEHAGH